jgi:YXWGXW repeat-containing protein
MKLKTLKQTILAGLLAGIAAPALTQIPVPPPPPLPGLEVRITTGRPPSPRYERRAPRPGANYVWVGGFWNWDNRNWRWVPGRWETRVAPEAYWIPARYIRTHRGYIYEPGHWSNQTVLVGDDIRRRNEWRRHEREHERELKRERDRERYRDRDERDRR